MAQQKIIPYALRITGTDKINSDLGKVAESLRLAIDLAKELGNALSDSFAGSNATQSVAQFKKLLDGLETKSKAIGEGLKDGLQVPPAATDGAIEDFEELLGKLRELGKENTSNTQQLRAYTAALKSGALDGTELYDELVKRVATLKNEQQDLTRTIKAQQKEFQQAEVAADSYKGLQIELGKLRNEWRQLSKDEREANQGLLDRIAVIDKELKDLDDDMGIYVRNVGNYRSVWANLNEDLQDAPGLLGDVGGGLNSLGSDMKKLLANPLILFLAAITAALKVLFDAFKRSEQGSELFAKASGALNAVLSLLTRFVVQLADGIAKIPDLFQKAFDDPIGSIKAFGQALFDGVVVRVQGLINLLGEAANVIGNVLIGEFDKAEAAAKRAGQAFVQASSGLDVEEQQRLADGLREVTAEVERQVEAFASLEVAKRNQARANQALEIQAANLAKQEELLGAIADDATLSFKERTAAAEEARGLIEQRAQAELEIARGNLAILEQEFQLRIRNGESADELRQERTDAIISVIDAEKELLTAQRDNEQQRRELVQDTLERNLDIYLDGFDRQKGINEQLLADERLTYRERQALLDETEQLGDKSFANQISTIQKFTNVRLDANSLLAESDAVVLQQRIRDLGLSEIIEGRILEVINERKTVLQDLTTAQQELNEVKQEELQTAIDLTFEERENIAAIAQEKRLISREEFSAKMVQLEIDRLQQELAVLELTEEEKAQKEQELALVRAEQVTVNYERDLAAAREAFEAQQAERETQGSEELLLIEQQFANKQITRQTLDEERARIEAEQREAQLESEKLFIEQQIELGTQFSLDTIGLKQQLADKEVEIAQNKNDQLLTNEQQTAAQRLAIQQQELGALGNFVGAVGDLLGQDEENRKKFAGILKALALGEIAINLIRELSQINANPVVNADVTQTTRTLLSGAAIARAAAATVKVATQEFEDGGVIDAASQPSGMIEGPSHADGGVKVLSQHGALYEVEGGEYWLKNGAETLVLNKRSSRQYKPVLDQLAVGGNIYSPARKKYASMINMAGGGVPLMNTGGVLDAAYTPLDAPIPSSLSELVSIQGAGNQMTPEEYVSRLAGALGGGQNTSGGTQIGNVILDASEAYQKGKEQDKRKRGL